MDVNQEKVNMRLSHQLTKAITAVLLVTSLSGCVPIVLAVGAVGGYAVSRDTFEGVTSKSQDELWDASQKVLSIMGTLGESNRNRGEMVGRVNGADVTITLLPVNLSTTKIRIKARKGILPRVGIAQEVYTKIMNQLGE